MPTTLRASRVPTRAGEVSVAQTGAGPALLLLHATAHDRRDYDLVLPELAKSFRVVAIDFPGHGESPQPLVPVTAPLLADVVEDVVDALSLERVAIVGNSVGGYAAARFAIRRAERCWGLVLVQTGGFLAPSLRVRLACRVLGSPGVFRRVVRTFAERYVAPRNEADRAAIERAVDFGRSRRGAEIAASIWRSFLDPDHDLRARAAAIRAPTLIVWGSRDLVRPVAEGHDVVRLVPNARIEVLETGHVPFVSNAPAFLAVVEPFLVHAGRSLAA